MVKKCSACGFENADDAKFCASCGHSLDASETANSGSNSVSNQKDRLSRTFDLFTKHLAIVIPAIILLVVYIILIVMEAIISYLTVSIVLLRVLGLIVSVIMAVVYLLTLHATMYGVREVINNRNVSIDSTFKRCFPTFHELFLPLVLIVVIGALVGYFVLFLSFLSFLVIGILSLPVYIMSASTVLGKSKGFSESFSWYTGLFNKDGASALVMLLGALFSVIPVLNLFTIPYTAELTYISVDEVAAPLNK